MRVFVALDIDESIRERIQRFMEGVRELAPQARWVPPESMHITLKFIGEKPPDVVEQIKRALSLIRGEAIEISFRGYGFFPHPRAARVFWAGMQAEPQLVKLAAEVDKAIVALGVPKDDHAFSPHLTLARGGNSSARRRRERDRPKSEFNRLQENLALLPEPEFGTMAAREFFLYQSKLSPAGSEYIKLEKFALNTTGP